MKDKKKSKWNLGLAIEAGDKAKEPVAPKAGSFQLLCRGEAGTGRGRAVRQGALELGAEPGVAESCTRLVGIPGPCAPLAWLWASLLDHKGVL